MGPVVLQKKMFEYLFLGVDGQIPWRRTTHAGRIGMTIAHYGPSGQVKIYIINNLLMILNAFKTTFTG